MIMSGVYAHAERRYGEAKEEAAIERGSHITRTWLRSESCYE